MRIREDFPGGRAVSQCLICWEALPTAERCTDCGRSACKDCLKAFLTSRIFQGHVGESFLACPNYDCAAPFTSERLEAILSEEAFAKLMRLRLVTAVNRDPKRCWCPNRECGAAVDLTRKTSRFSSLGSANMPKFRRGAKCEACGDVFCTRCGSAPHRGKCPRDASYTEWVATAAHAPEDGVQECPRCHHHIEKRGGCQHMSCSMCSAEWCWICRCSWRGHQLAVCRAVSVYRHEAWGDGPLERAATMSAALPIGLCVGAGVLALGTVIGAGWVIGMTGYVTIVLPGKTAQNGVCRTWRRRQEARSRRRAAETHADVPEDVPECMPHPMPMRLRIQVPTSTPAPPARPARPLAASAPFS